MTYPFSPCLKSPSCTASKLGVQYSVFLGRRLKYNKNRIHETVEKPKIPKPKKKKTKPKKNQNNQNQKNQKKAKTKKNQKSPRVPENCFFLVFWFWCFVFFWFWYFCVFGFGILAFWFAFTVRGNNYTFFCVLMLIVLFRNSIQVVFLVLQNYLFRYYVSRAASV